MDIENYDVLGWIWIEEKYKAELEKYKVENFVDDGKHYSHDHPLRLMSRCEDDKEEVGDDDDKSLCSICGVPILSSPSYTCTLGCKFFLHQPCALNLPTKLIHPTHGLPYSGKHILYIKKSSTFFSYQCDNCRFSLHPLVAFPHLEIKTKHMSHTSHSLVVLCKRISCECDVCGREEKGFFFYCGDCNFWIHQDCTILPTTLQFAHHQYPFILSYSLPYYHVDGCCIVCNKILFARHNGVYFSPHSSTFAHAACGSTHQFASQARLNLIQLPDDEWDNTFPILVLRKYAEIKPFTPLVDRNRKKFIDAIDDGDDVDDDDDDADHYNYDDDAKLTIKEYHKHPLVLIEDGNTSRELAWSLYCDLCTRSINNSSSFYKCDSCHFAAHKLCADILPLLKFFIPDFLTFAFYGKLYPNPSEAFFNSVFYCFICRRPCNGLCYYFDDIIDMDKLFVDLECMAAPSIINRVSHAQHLLIRTHRVTGVTPLPCCPGESYLYDVYRCHFCDYYIHTSCAMLPKRIICHDYDEHPLHLAFTTPLSYSFCEVCEEDIDLKYWFYQCRECDKSFHINCIPSLGYLSKVKFGGTLGLPDSHAHPLALTRMLTVPSQRCGYCNQIIQGLLDQMAFFCSQCHFWLHFSCARDLAATPKTTNRLILYSEIDYEKFIYNMRKNFIY